MIKLTPQKYGIGVVTFCLSDSKTRILVQTIYEKLEFCHIIRMVIT